MSEELNSWINELWEKTKPPEVVAEKQVWVVFPLEENTENPSEKGSIVVVLSTDEKTASVVPAHHELSTRTFVDPILSKNDFDLDFDDRLVCVAHLLQRLSHQAFKNARFLGGLTDNGLDKVNAAVSNFYTVLDELAHTQYLEATDAISDQDLENAFNAGILKIYPTKVSLEDLNSLYSALEANLLGWQEHAIEQVICEKEKEYIDVESVQPEEKATTFFEHPFLIYGCMVVCCFFLIFRGVGYFKHLFESDYVLLVLNFSGIFVLLTGLSVLGYYLVYYYFSLESVANENVTAENPA